MTAARLVRRAAPLVALAALLAAAPACRRHLDPCGDPLVAAQAFVKQLESGDTAGALPFLSRAARTQLETQAAEASRTLGQRVDPADLLIPERSVLARSDWLALRSVGAGEAWVDVRPPLDAGPAPRGPWSAQRLVLEDGCWKVDLFHEAGLSSAAPDGADGGADDAAE